MKAQIEKELTGMKDSRIENIGMRIIRCTRKELKNLNASDMKHGDCVIVGKYYISIRYGTFEEPDMYRRPGLCSYTELENGQRLDCTPGTSHDMTPYFIDDFLGR